MKLLSIVGIRGVLLAVLLAAFAFAGDLLPSQAPGPTMKTLQEVYDKADAAEVWIPITSIPITIDEPGSYYLAQDLGPAPADTNGITINTRPVTIELNGFSLIGAGKATGSSGDGISAGTHLDSLVVRNGTVRSWRNNGIGFSNTNSVVCKNLCCRDNGNNGIYVYQDSIVEKCICIGNGLHGIEAFMACIFKDNVCKSNNSNGMNFSGSIATGNLSRYNEGIGISCGAGSFLSENQSCSNLSHGIENSYYCRIVNNLCTHNGRDEGEGAGIRSLGVSTIENNHVAENDYGIKASLTDFIVSNRARGNTDNYNWPNSARAGEIVTLSGAISANTSPFANFEF